MIARVIGALIVVGIVIFAMISLSGKTKDIEANPAVSKLQQQLDSQRQQVEGLEGVPPQPQPHVATDTAE